MKLKLLRAAKRKSALVQTQHKRSYPILQDLLLIAWTGLRWRFQVVFPLHSVVSAGHTSAMSRIIYVTFEGSLTTLWAISIRVKEQNKCSQIWGPQLPLSEQGGLELGEKCILDQRERNYWQSALPPPVLCCLYGSLHAWPFAGAWFRVLNLTLWIRCAE